jgi:hypothetical protein
MLLEPASPAVVYENFLEHLSNQLGGANDAQPLRGALERGVHRELLQLLMTFSDFSPVSKEGATRTEEWNPLSQRPVVPEGGLVLDALDQDFESQADGVRRYIGTAHELMHCLLWEPFFGGSFLPRKAVFAEVSLAFEALCFWHSDIVLTPQIRALAPDNEFVYDRSALSQRHFHPYRAFKALGMDDPMSILDVYLAAFTGHRSALHDADDLFARNLARRAIQLYVIHMRSLPALFGELKRHGSFGAFYRRFCARAGVPTLFVAPYDPGTQTFAYCRWVAETGLAAVASSDESLLSAVQARRRVQTRAYHALQLQAVLQAGNVFLRTRGARDRKAIERVVARLDAYLTDLELALLALCRKDPLERVLAQVSEADQRYEAEVRVALQRPDAWVASRTLIIGPTPKTIRSGNAVVIGCDEWLRRAPARAIDKLVGLLVSEFLPRMAKSLARGADAQVDLAEAYAKASRILRSHAAFKQDATRGRAALGGHIGSFLRMEPVKAMWSVRLSSVSPANGQFRELPFIFE